MKKVSFVFLLILFVLSSGAQPNIDSLLQVANTSSTDTGRVFSLERIAAALMYSSPDTSLQYAEKALSLSQEKKFRKGEANSLSIIGNNYSIKGNYTQSFESHIKALRIYEEIKDLVGIGSTYNNLALIYDDQGEYRKALDNYLKARKIYEQLKAKDRVKFEQTKMDNNVVIILNNIGNDYEKMNKLDSALLFQNQSYELARKIKDKNTISTILSNLGNINYKLGRMDVALDYYRTSLPYALHIGDKQNLADANLGIANVLEYKQRKDSAIFYAQQSYKYARQSSYMKGAEKASLLLSQLYESLHKMDSTFMYFKMSHAIKDSILNSDVVRQLQIMNFNEQKLQQEKKVAKQQYLNNLKMYALASGLVLVLLLAGFLFRNNRQKQKANTLLQKQQSRTEQALEELKATQAQLIQKEKMASLGELTAGIAHEIQNPLNFVNNFSEVNVELIDEMHQELQTGNTKEAIKISNEIKEINTKVIHHGKRADAIVKGMLQHSRMNTGQKEPTDINDLADEYLRLSYHGLRAKDKTFNATLQTDFDNSIGAINAVSPDIGRVLLNLFNNAFYAVKEKKKQADSNYEPMVSVSTKTLDGQIEICIKDNGNGIPQEIINKIFQPFFTTKPTGEGTGLGLSLSYDIIKAHCGELEVESKEGEGAAFIIRLPLA